ncbi:hypothetical protein HY772_00790 [Candidatus Woesearchaeota archaeon]|nr:hypothetical protein [Candidatus Woesearchaeota archaeon]
MFERQKRLLSVFFVLLCSLVLLGCALVPRQSTQPAAPSAEQDSLPQAPTASTPLVGADESKTQESQQPLAAPPQKTQTGLTLTDEIYEYNTRRYYYDDKTFGIGINYNTDAREATGLLGEGDSYVTRDGIKITINKFFPNKFEFTLSKVAPEQHVPLCPECVKISDVHVDSGVRFVNLHEEKMYALKGKQYTFRVSEIDPTTNSAVLKIDTQELPPLESGQTHVLRDGNAIKFLFAAAHQLAGYDGYGYAAFGFVPTTDLPAQVICPECTDFMYLRDGASQKFSYNNFDHTFALENRDGALVLVYDNDIQAALEADKVVKVNDQLSAKLLSMVAPHLIGLIVQGHLETRTTCEPSAERNLFKKGRVRITTGSDESRFDREDFCRDDNTLVDYACAKVPGRGVSSDGHGRTAAMTVTTCACKDGACTK